jgi:hypothetical protein
MAEGPVVSARRSQGLSMDDLEYIQLRCETKDMPASGLLYTIKRGQPLRKMMQAYCEYKGLPLPPDTVFWLPDGRELAGTVSAEGNGLQWLDTVVADPQAWKPIELIEPKAEEEKEEEEEDKFQEKESKSKESEGATSEQGREKEAINFSIRLRRGFSISRSRSRSHDAAASSRPQHQPRHQPTSSKRPLPRPPPLPTKPPAKAMFPMLMPTVPKQPDGDPPLNLIWW